MERPLAGYGSLGLRGACAGRGSLLRDARRSYLVAVPRQSAGGAPGRGAFPSAEGAHAAIYQQTVWGGLKWEYKWNEHWEHSVGVYGAWSGLRNPSIRNYEKRNEPHAGARTVVTYKKGPGACWRAQKGKGELPHPGVHQ